MPRPPFIKHLIWSPVAPLSSRTELNVWRLVKRETGGFGPAGSDPPEKALKPLILAEKKILPVKTFAMDRDIWRLLVIA